MAFIYVNFGFRLYLLLFSSLLNKCNAYVPKVAYLVDCGSGNETRIGSRVFNSDFYQTLLHPTPNNIFGSTRAFYVSSFDSAPLYQTARLFFGPFTYTFAVPKHVRHFIRLYFFPFKYKNYDLTSAIFTVSTQDLILLSNFQVTNSAAVFKEFSLNMTTGVLNLTFTPVGRPLLAFVNAIEVISVPDDLINDFARPLNALGTYDGLSHEVLETVYRINMGGSKISPDEDALARTWITDENFIVDTTVAKFVNISMTIERAQPNATEEIAPDLVYITGTELVASDTSLPVNVTWEFNVSTSSSPFMIRLHFCDIISKKPNQLYFNVYINHILAVKDLNLSVNGFVAPKYIDFVGIDNVEYGIIRVSIGPSSMGDVLPDGLLNGLEIMSMRFSSNSLNGHIADTTFSKKKFGVILGLLCGVFVLAVFTAGVLMVVGRRRKI